MKLLSPLVLTVALATSLVAHPGGHYDKDPFRQLDEILPDPNEVRAANGAPGPEYWQQRADYKIAVTLDDEKQRLTGSETITYTNNSPVALTYLWVQLDQNRFEEDAMGHQAMEAPDFEDFGYRNLRDELTREDFQGGFEIELVGEIVKMIDAAQPVRHNATSAAREADSIKHYASSVKVVAGVGFEPTTFRL